jgi:type IV secretory pathway TraG/TraD family ATPase VirD4
VKRLWKTPGLWVTITFTPALTSNRPYSSPSSRSRSCRPGAGEGFDIAAYLGSPGTLYVLAGEGDQRIAPLLTALTEAVFSTAKQVAATHPGGQLDPPLGLFLDEIANITPVPLDNWAADSRGWGITVWAVAQDLAQLGTRWGRTRAHTIFANLPTRIVLPGVAAREVLEHLAYLAGQRTVVQTSEGRSDTGEGRCTRSRNQSKAREPVVTGHTIYGLPRWHAYVLGLGTKSAIVRFEPGWRRRRLIPVPSVRRPVETERVAPVTLTAVPDPVGDAA